MKILIADDDRVSLMMMRRMLRESGYEVCTVSDGPAAIQEISREDSPRLLLLDWMMPSLNGPDVCKAIRAQPHRGYVYIILLTAKDTKEDLIKGLEAGADDFLTKPCHPEELQARLRTGERILRLEDGLVETRDEMHFRATHDALTGLLNRGAIVSALSTDLANHSGQRSSAVLLCDVDHFKQINDTYGHPVGDEALCGVARRLESLTLADDRVGRFGGEEFLLLLRDTAPEQLEALGENICKAVRSAPIETSVGALPVTLSIGVLGIEQGAGSLSVDGILLRADQLLYGAKNGGRDRAVADVYLGVAVTDFEEQATVSFSPRLLRNSGILHQQSEPGKISA